MLHKIMFRSFCCCCSLKHGCSAIGALEWICTVYLSCRYYDIDKMGCKGLKLSCSQIYYNVVSFLISVAIISGVKKNSRAYFIPWLIIKFVEYSIFTALMIYELQTTYPIMNSDVAVPMTLVIISILVFYYSWLCVLSLYINMGHEEEKLGDQEESQLQEMV